MEADSLKDEVTVIECCGTDSGFDVDICLERAARKVILDLRGPCFSISVGFKTEDARRLARALLEALDRLDQDREARQVYFGIGPERKPRGRARDQL